MKVLGISKFGRRNLAFVEHPKPLPQSSTDVLIKIQYSDLNPVDHHKLNMKADGVDTTDHRTPYIVGFGGSGIVEEISSTADDETRSLLNKRVVFIADPSKDGSYAEYICCDRRIVSPIPESIKSHAAACIPIAGCTAFECLGKVGLPISDSPPATNNCKGEGKRLLSIGGSGGVGSFATLLARSNYPSLDIVCTVGSDESAAWLRKWDAIVQSNMKTYKSWEVDAREVVITSSALQNLHKIKFLNQLRKCSDRKERYVW